MACNTPCLWGADAKARCNIHTMALRETKSGTTNTLPCAHLRWLWSGCCFCVSAIATGSEMPLIRVYQHPAGACRAQALAHITRAWECCGLRLVSPHLWPLARASLATLLTTRLWQSMRIMRNTTAFVIPVTGLDYFLGMITCSFGQTGFVQRPGCVRWQGQNIAPPSNAMLHALIIFARGSTMQSVRKITALFSCFFLATLYYCGMEVPVLS